MDRRVRRKLAISAATPWAANLLLKFHIREGFQKMWNLSLLSCWGSRRLTIQNHSWTPKTCYSYGLDCLMFIASISDDFESYHFFAVSGWSSLKMSNNPKRYCIMIFLIGTKRKIRFIQIEVNCKKMYEKSPIIGGRGSNALLHHYTKQWNSVFSGRIFFGDV